MVGGCIGLYLGFVCERGARGEGGGGDVCQDAPYHCVLSKACLVGEHQLESPEIMLVSGGTTRFLRLLLHVNKAP